MAENFDKLCKDCRHSIPRFANFMLCLHPKNMVISPVDGQREIDRSCQSLRESSTGCGGNAAWWEVK